jgi:hypothetical protein
MSTIIPPAPKGRGGTLFMNVAERAKGLLRGAPVIQKITREPEQHEKQPNFTKAQEEAVIEEGVGEQPDKVLLGLVDDEKWYTSSKILVFYVNPDKARELKESYLSRSDWVSTYTPAQRAHMKGLFKKAKQIRAERKAENATRLESYRQAEGGRRAAPKRDKAAPQPKRGKAPMRTRADSKGMGKKELFALLGIK